MGNDLALKLQPIVITKKTKQHLNYWSQYNNYIESNKLQILIYALEDEKVQNINLDVLEFLYGINDKLNFKVRTPLDLNISELLKYKPEIVNSMATSPIERFITTFETLDSRDKYVLINRSTKRTLEEIGLDKGVTRERIRQIESKAMKKLMSSIKDLIIYYTNESYYLDLDLMASDLSFDNLDLLQYLIDYHPKVFKSNFTNKIVFDKQKEEIINSKINVFTKEKIILKEDINIILGELESEGINYLEKKDIENILKSEKYFLHKEEWLKFDKVSDPYIHVIRKDFKEGINLQQNVRTNDYDKLLKIVKERFNVDSNYQNIRSLVLRIRENLIPIDRSIFVVRENFKFDNEVIGKIINSIKDSKREVYYFSELFNRYQEELIQSGILNQYALRSAFEISTAQFDLDRDKLIISDGTVENLSTLLENFILKKQNAVNIDNIVEEFKYFNVTMLYQELYSNKLLVNWGHKWYIHKNNIPFFSDEIIKKINLEFEQNEFISYDRFISFFTNDTNLIKFGLFFKHDVVKLLEHSFDEKYKYVDGVVWKNNTIPKFETRVLKYLSLEVNDNIFISEVRNFIRKNKIPYHVGRDFIAEIDKKFLKKDNLCYYPKNYKIKIEAINILKSEIDELFKIEKYLTLETIVQNCYLPMGTLNWNKEVISSLVKYHLDDYYDFFPVGTDKLLTTYGVLVPSGKFNDVSDVIFSYLRNLGLKSIDENELYEFLKQYHISKTGIPSEFYNNSNYPLEKNSFILQN